MYRSFTEPLLSLFIPFIVWISSHEAVNEDISFMMCFMQHIYWIHTNAYKWNKSRFSLNIVYFPGVIIHIFMFFI